MDDTRNLPCRRRNTERETGFSLLEILGAILLISVGLLAMVGVTVHRARLAAEADAKTLVLTAAQGLLEEIRASDPTTIEADFSAPRTVTGVTESQLSVTVDDTNPRLPQITVSGTWSVNGADQEMTITTGIYNPGG